MTVRILMRLGVIALGIACAGIARSAEQARVPRFGIFETSLQHAGMYENPYWDVEATAELTGPEGKSVVVDLFWDGERTWKFRYSPPTAGLWSWKTASKDAGLDGKRGEFTCVASTLRGGIRAMKDYPYHLAYEDGTPFWLLGDWLCDVFGIDPPMKFTREAFEDYVKLRASQKFNYIQGILTSPGGGNEGGPVFLDIQDKSMVTKPRGQFPARQLNPAYFREVDSRLAFLERYGCTTMIFISWSNPQAYIIAWRYFADQEARERFARYAISRYGAHNVCFGVTGEWGLEPELRPSFLAMGGLLQAHNPQNRMIAIHPALGSTREFAEYSWMHFGDYQQNYDDIHNSILKSRFLDPRKNEPWPAERRKPVVNGEYALFMRDLDGDGKVDKNNSDSVQRIRGATYDIVMAGGYFVTGFGSTFWGGYKNPPDGFVLNDPIDDPWEEQVQHIHDLFTSLAWWRLEPSDHLVKAVVTGKTPVAWCLAEPGRQYLVYVRNVSKVTVELQDIGAPYTLISFDPRTGKRTQLGAVEAGKRELTAPDMQDYLFILTGGQ